MERPLSANTCRHLHGRFHISLDASSRYESDEVGSTKTECDSYWASVCTLKSGRAVHNAPKFKTKPNSLQKEIVQLHFLKNTI